MTEAGLILKGGKVFDGAGSPGIDADVWVVNGRVKKIAAGIKADGATVKDVHGQWIMPGLVDNHTHYDVEVEIAPGLQESVRHGITTIVMGNCSLSIMMGPPQDLADVFLRVENLPGPLVRRWLSDAHHWKSSAEYMAHLRELKLGPRVCVLLGHSALRVAAMGLERSLQHGASDSDLTKMRELAIEALDAGASGISIDMVHWHKITGRLAGHSVPSHYAELREYRILAELCRERDLVFSVIPDPSRPWCLFPVLFWSVGLFRAPLRLNILSALDVSTVPWLWRTFPLTTFVYNKLLDANVRFQTLTEPFKIYADGPLTPLFEEFPAGVELNSCRSRDERKALLASKEFRIRFKSDWTKRGIRSFHRDLRRMTIVRFPGCADDVSGTTFADLARMQGRRNTDETLEFFLDLLAEHDSDLRWFSVGANDRPQILEKLMSHRYIIPGFTDAGAHSRNLAFFDGPLSLLRHAVQTGFMPIERAIQRVTSESCRWFQIEGGFLREGTPADLIVVNPEGLKQPVSAAVEIQDPLLEGALRMVKRGSENVIQSVLVSGIEVVRDGVTLPALGHLKTGSVLTPQTRVRTREQALVRYRNRIDDQTFDHPFSDYWDIFVFKHQDRKNILIHCFAVFIMYAVWIGVAVTGNPWWLALAFLSQVVGLSGHLLFEKNHVDVRDFVFSWRASRCLNRMFWSVIRRNYHNEIIRVRTLFESREA